MEANAFPGVDVVKLQGNITYLLTIGGLPPIVESVNIAGAGAGSTIIDGNCGQRRWLH